jgi:outer membrane protein OmpA-like peptidoglycan-associated protein
MVVEYGSRIEFVIAENSEYILRDIFVNSHPVEVFREDEHDYKWALREVVGNTTVEAKFDKIEKVVISKVASVQEGIFFKNGSAELLPESRKTLEGLYLTLVEHHDTKIEIAGHTTTIGSREYNMTLSKNRAQAVVDYLVVKGISADRLTAVGYGPDRPIADNTTEVGRQKNRRVEIRTIN